MQLAKIGKRKCFRCKKVLDLNENNFYRSSTYGTCGFRRECKECARSHMKTKEYKGYKKKYREKHTTRKRNNQKRLRLRFSILERDNFTCQYCGRPAPEVKLEVDHIYPKSKGGRNKKRNYRTACKECNIGKGDSILNEFN